MNLTEAEWLTLCFNPELRAARAAADVVRAGAQEAGWLDDPEFELAIARFLGEVESPWIGESSIGFTIPLSNRLSVSSLCQEEAGVSPKRVRKMSVRVIFCNERAGTTPLPELPVNSNSL